MHILEDLLQNIFLIFCVQHNKVFGETEDMGVLFEQLYAEGVNRADKTEIQVISEHLPDSEFHLIGCAVREGDAQDVFRSNTQRVDKIAVAACQGAGFTGAGTCDDTDRAFGLLYGCELIFCEILEEIGHTCSPWERIVIWN